MPPEEKTAEAIHQEVTTRNRATIADVVHPPTQNPTAWTWKPFETTVRSRAALFWLALAVVLVGLLCIVLGVLSSTGLRAVNEETPQLLSRAWAASGFFIVIAYLGAMMLGKTQRYASS